MNGYPWQATARGLVSGALFPALIVVTHAVGIPRALTLLLVVIVNTVAFFSGMFIVGRRDPGALQPYVGAYFFALTTGLVAIGWRAGVSPWQLALVSLFAVAGLWRMVSRPARG